MVKKLTFLTFIAVLVFYGAYTSEAAGATETRDNLAAANPDDSLTFRDQFAGRFLIGAALNKNQIMGDEIGVLDFKARMQPEIT